MKEVQIYQLFFQPIYPSLQLFFTLVEILSINKPNSLGGAQNVTKVEVLTFKYGADINILVPKPSCTMNDGPDIDLLW